MCVTRSQWTTSLFFFTKPATTEIYTLSLHDALPIYTVARGFAQGGVRVARFEFPYMHARRQGGRRGAPDRSEEHTSELHPSISYAVFCLKKKNSTCTAPHTRRLAWRRRASSSTSRRL